MEFSHFRLRKESEGCHFESEGFDTTSGNKALSTVLYINGFPILLLSILIILQVSSKSTLKLSVGNCQLLAMCLSYY